MQRACNAMCAWRLLLLAAMPALVGVGAGEVLEVRAGPEFLPTRRSVTASLGGDVALACRIANLGDKAVSWVRARDLHILAHAGAVFSADPRVDVRVSGADGPGAAVTHTLHLARLRATDAGRYECQLNTDPKLSQIYNLTVTDGPLPRVEVRVLGARMVRGTEGGAATLGCNARLTSAMPGALQITWYRDGQALLPQSGRLGGVALDTERSEGRASSRLTLAALTPSDAGRYVCRARALKDGEGGEGDGEGPEDDEMWGEETLTLLVEEAGVGSMEAMQRDQSPPSPGAASPRVLTASLLPLAMLAAAALH